MDEKERATTAGRAQAAPICPVCGHSVGTTVRRYKTLGAFVPRWTAAPCGNPDCGSQQTAAHEPAPQAARRHRARGPHGAHRADTAR
jgi:hypothetical protein